MSVEAPITPKQVEDLLKAAAAADNRDATVQVIETHISWVFLAGAFAYKLKKPVRFEFLDFSTRDLRYQACLEEIRLNKRLAPDVYLSVLPITQASDGGLALSGDGKPIDWLVQMRRLPADNTVDVLLRECRLTPAHVQAIANHLAQFYTSLFPRPITAEEYRSCLGQHIRSNATDLLTALPSDRSRLLRIQESQLRFLSLAAELLDRRVASGHVIDGHGDLRPQHIYVNGQPLVIDCIEFSPELRTIDIADELSFLAMECERLGDGGLGTAVMAAYAQKSGDSPSPTLLDFYRSYRASVRAKVAVLRAQQQKESARRGAQSLAEQYLELADRHAGKLGGPMLLVISGLMGSGKSTLAVELRHALDCEVISTDHVRRETLGSSAAAGYGEGKYQSNLRTLVYEEVFRRAANFLKESRSIILDGTFLLHSLRKRAIDEAQNYGAAYLHVNCICGKETALARIEHRRQQSQTESEARADLYDSQADEFEPYQPNERVLAIDTTRPLRDQVTSVLEAMRMLLFAGDITTPSYAPKCTADVSALHSSKMSRRRTADLSCCQTNVGEVLRHDVCRPFKGVRTCGDAKWNSGVDRNCRQSGF